MTEKWVIETEESPSIEHDCLVDECEQAVTQLEGHHMVDVQKKEGLHCKDAQCIRKLKEVIPTEDDAAQWVDVGQVGRQKFLLVSGAVCMDATNNQRTESEE